MELRPEDRDSLNQERELSNGQDIVIVNTALIMKAMQGMQKAQADFQELLERAELGDASVQYELGVRYATGDGVEADMAQAAHWFAQAAETGDLRAVDALGRCYQNGSGVEQDQERGAELFRQAAEEGFAGALCDLGLC